MRLASATASSTTFSWGTTWLTNPRASARWASTVSPVRVELQGDRHRDAAAEEDPSAGREERPLDLRHPEAGVGGDDGHVTGEEQLEAPRHRRPVRCGDDGLAAAVADKRRVRRRAGPAFLVLGATGAGGEATQVHAGTEGPVTGGGHDHGPHVGIGLGVSYAHADTGQDRCVERVTRLGSVDPKDLDRTPTLYFDICHEPDATFPDLSSPQPLTRRHHNDGVATTGRRGT